MIPLCTSPFGSLARYCTIIVINYAYVELRPFPPYFVLFLFPRREVGGAMSEYYAHVRPKMSDFDVQVRIDVVSTKVIVGTQINVDDLSKERHFLRFRNAVTIKTNLAYAMIRCANIKAGDLVVDVSVCMSFRVHPVFQQVLALTYH